MCESTSYTYRGKAKRPKVLAKQKIPRISLTSTGFLLLSPQNIQGNLDFRTFQMWFLTIFWDLGEICAKFVWQYQQNCQLCHQEQLKIGFCVSNFLSILSDFLSRGKLTQKWLEPKAEQIDQNTNFAKYICSYFCISLQVIYNCSAFRSSYFVSVSLVRENLRVLKENLKCKIRT